MAVEVRVLGPLEVVRGDEVLPIRGAKPRTALLALTARAGSVVSVDELIDALWGEQPPATARAALQMHITALRKVLGHDAIATEPAGYRLSLGDEATDAWIFERRSEAGRAALRKGDLERAARLLREGQSVWRGRAFLDVEFAEFAQPAAARLEELRIQAVEDRLDAEIGLGRGTDILSELRELVETHPFRERLAAQLMTVLYREGAQAEALAVYEATRRRLVEQLGIDPGPALQAIHQQVLMQELSLASAPRVDGVGRPVPYGLTELVGRDDALVRICADLRSRRLVTLTGPGGVGKTRLAIEVARRLDDELPGGARFVDLSAAREAHELEVGGGGAFNDDAPSDAFSLESLTTATREATLLVLDNLEQIAGAADEIIRILELAPDIRLLLTSREPLRVRGEHEIRVEPLESEAAQLLLTLRAGDAGVDLGTAELGDLCARLDNLPLALELVAPRLRLLTPQELLQRLDDRLDMTSGPRDLPARQRTLRATIAWSYELLHPAEQAAFRRLSLFAGGGTVAAAERVGEVPLEELLALVDKSLLRGVPGRTGARLVMLETIREYASELLAGDELAGVERRHLEFYALLAADAATASRRDEEEWLSRINAEEANLLVALEIAARSGEHAHLADMLAGLARYWDRLGRYRIGLVWLERALELVTLQSQRAELLDWHGMLLFKTGDLDAAWGRFKEALGCWEAVDARRETIRPIIGLGLIETERHHFEAAERFYEQALELSVAVGDEHHAIAALGNLGATASHVGDPARAAELFEQMILNARACGSTAHEAQGLSNLGEQLWRLGELAGAEAALREGIGLLQLLGWTEGIVYSLVPLAAVTAAAGNLERAVVLLATADQLAARIELGWQASEDELRADVANQLRSALGDGYLAAWDRASTSDPLLVVQQVADLPGARPAAAQGGEPDSPTA